MLELETPHSLDCDSKLPCVAGKRTPLSLCVCVCVCCRGGEAGERDVSSSFLNHKMLSPREDGFMW